MCRATSVVVGWGMVQDSTVRVATINGVVGRRTSNVVGRRTTTVGAFFRWLMVVHNCALFSCFCWYFFTGGLDFWLFGPHASTESIARACVGVCVCMLFFFIVVV